MLKELRKSATGFFAKLMLGLMVIIFSAWGIGDALRHGGPQTVATIDGDNISLQEYERQIAVLKRSIGKSMPTSGINLVMLQRMILNEMISDRLVAKEADRLGIRISDEALAREISRNEDFRNSTGDFDKSLFQQTLRQNNLTESDYLKQLRNALKQELLMGVLNGEQVTPAHYGKLIYAADAELRTIDLISISDANHQPNIAEPSEQEIDNFYKENQTRFIAPEYRTLSFLRVTPDDISKKVIVTRQELFTLYNERATSLMVPEKRDIMHMLFTNKADAENVYSILRGGQSFTEAAKLVPPTNKDALNLGMVTREQLPPEAAKVFSLGEGEFTEPTESRFGWHVYFVKKIQEQRTTPFEEVQKNLEQELRQSKAEAALQETLETLQDALAGTDSLETAGKESEVAFVKTDPVDGQGHGVDNQEILPAASYGEMLNNAFKISEGERSEVMKEADGSYYVVKVEAISPQRQRTLDEVRGQVTDEWKKDKRLEARKADASKLATELAGKHSVDAIQKHIKELSLDVSSNLMVKRSGAVIGADNISLPPSLVKEIFSLKESGAVSPLQSVGDNFVVAVLKKISPAPDPKKSAQAEQELRGLNRKLRTDYISEMQDQYISYLRTRYPVEINEALLAQMAAQKK